MCFFYSVLFEMTFIPRPEKNFVYLIRHFTNHEWPFDMFTEIFGLLKINESTCSDKDEEVQRRTEEVYSENLRNTKHATQVRREFLHHYGIKGGRKRSQFTAKDFERVNYNFDITGSVHETPKKTSENEKNPRKRWKTEGDVQRQATVFSKEHCASVDTKSYYSLDDSALRH